MKISNSNEVLSKIKTYQQEFLSIVSEFQYGTLIDASRVLLKGMLEGRSVFVCGNGGSAALSQHFAIDLGLGTRRKSNFEGCRVFDLTANTVVLTATANDLDFESIFANQIELYGKEEDLLFVFSSSGNSKNIVNAVRTANGLGLLTIGFTGFDGGLVREMLDISIHVDTEKGDYGRVEDVHSYLLHLLTHIIRSSVKELE